LYRPSSIPSMNSDDTPGSCCAPAREPSTGTRAGAALAAPRDVAPDSQRAMVSLPPGTFLMGTDYERGFPADGEGPVRPVSLSAFNIDTYPVTNADFAALVAATNFRTEAEVFGWSFVFWSHIPPERFEELVEDTAAPRVVGSNRSSIRGETN
jgi:formylglycine-generating enzyme